MKCIINKIWKEKKGEVKRPNRAWLKSGGEVSGRAACLQRPQIRSTVSISRWGHTDSFKRHPSRLLNSPRNPKHFSKHSKSLKKELLFPNTEEKFQSGDNNVFMYRKKKLKKLYFEKFFICFLKQLSSLKVHSCADAVVLWSESSCEYSVFYIAWSISASISFHKFQSDLFYFEIR